MRPSTSERLHERVLDEEHQCRVCGRPGYFDDSGRHSLEVDHIEPLWAGGADDRANLQALCVACHKAKTKGEAGPRWSVGLEGRRELEKRALSDPTRVGLGEIAERLGVRPATASRWLSRGILPEPPYGGWGWRWPDIETWARATGRLPRRP
jgi:hypothetical protein